MSDITNAASQWVVLIVDDEPDNLTVPKEVLSFYGAKVHTAEDGVEAIQALETMVPTFILLDLSMPKMDGWETLKHIRANPSTARIPVIALTAHAMSGDKERVEAAGFDGYIAKPFWFPTFWAEIERCLSGVLDVSDSSESQ